MKKTLLFLCLTLASTVTFAQSDKNVTFGVKGGVNFASTKFSGVSSPGFISTSLLTTFNVGAFVDFKVCESVSIQPALIFTGKGGKSHGNFPAEFTFDYNDETTIYYLQVPVNIIYHVPVGKHDLYFGAGPFAGYGISGKQKITSTLTEAGVSTPPLTQNNDITFGDNEPNLAKRWDYGLGALAGFKFDNGFLVNLNYDLGLANTTPKYDGSNTKTKTRVFGLSVGYAF